MPGVTDKASARGHVATRTNQGSHIDNITEKPDYPPSAGHAQKTNSGQLVDTG